jgi:gliding motility-associated lipoprotein GldH
MRKVVLLLVVVLTGCTQSVYRESYDFPDNQWKRADSKLFEIPIHESGLYDISVEFRHVYGTPMAEIPLVVSFVGDKVKKTVSYPLMLIDADGKMLSECIGDVCDIEAVILKNQQLESGSYKLTLSHTFDHEYLPNTPSVGIKVTKAGQ